MPAVTDAHHDQYADAIAYLTRRPKEIVAAWRSWNTHPAGCLFAPAVPDLSLDYDGAYRGNNVRPDGAQCGCLTEVRAGTAAAWTDDLTERIRADRRIPALPHQVKVEHLPAFAAWQRDLDATIRAA